MPQTATLRPGMPLSSREEQALVAYALCGSIKDGATSLGISHHTMRSYLSGAYVKLGVERAIEAFAALGWLTVPPALAGTAAPSHA